MVMRKEDTPQRVWNRTYEEKHKEQRKATSGNFQTMMPRAEFEEINRFLADRGITKVDLIRAGYEALKLKALSDSDK